MTESRVLGRPESPYRVYTFKGILVRSTILQCVLAFVQRYNNIPAKIRLSPLHELRAKLFDLSDAGGAVLEYQAWVGKNEVWVGPVPETKYE